MDIIVRGGEGIVDPDELLALSPSKESWVWRGRKPLDTEIGDKVYFVDRGGIYLCGTYAGYGDRTSNNLQGATQTGGAILLKAPVKRINPPFILDPATLRGPWRWRYDRRNFRQNICPS